MAHVSFPVDENRWPRPLGQSPDNRVTWNSTDGPSQTTQWRIIVGSYSGGSDYYRGPWRLENAGNRTNTLNINLTSQPPQGYRCHIRAQYYTPGNGLMQNGATSQFYYYP
jgi:hypothetical protein